MEITFYCSDLHDGAIRAMNLLRRVDLGIVSLSGNLAEGRYSLCLTVDTSDRELVERLGRQIGQIPDVDGVQTGTGDRRAA